MDSDDDHDGHHECPDHDLCHAHSHNHTLANASSQELTYAFGLLAAASLATIAGAAVAVALSRRYDLAATSQFIVIGLAFAAGMLLYVAFATVLPEADAAYCCVTHDHYSAATLATLCGGVLLAGAFDLLVHRVQRPRRGGAGERTGLRSPTNETSALLPAEEEGRRRALASTGVALAMALALHNVPEGILLFLGAVSSTDTGLTLVLAIAMHNLPLGASIAVPIIAAHRPGWFALGWAGVAGMAQFLSGLVGYAVLHLGGGGIPPDLYAVFFGLAGGILIFVAVHELVPAAVKMDGSGGRDFTRGFLLGVVVMALTLVVLDELGGHAH